MEGHEFIKGMQLGRGFFFEAAKPLLDERFGGLAYSAGLVGYGSDVLGYDDPVSTDHMWGPRFYLFVGEGDAPQKQALADMFARCLPREYKGFPVLPDLMFVHTVDEYLVSYLGVGAARLGSLSGREWLAFSEHRLLSLAAGEFFVDSLGFADTLARLRYYPEDVRLYLIASNWSLVAEEQAYVRRCHDVGDALGSVLACGRIAERLMRLAFLYCRQYAPYSKWFGTAFARLPFPEAAKEAIRGAVFAGGAGDIERREAQIVAAQKLMADFHNEAGLTDFVPVQIESYHERDIKVIFADKIASAAMDRLRHTEFARYPLIGTLSGVANFTNIFDNPLCREQVMGLYPQPENPAAS